jgi:hypothetical protein
VPQDFLLQDFSEIISPQAPENNTWVVLNFFQKCVEIFTSQGAPPVSTIPVANTEMETISLLIPESELEEKLIYMLTLLPKGIQQNI